MAISLAGCGFTHPREQCRTCIVYDRHDPPAAVPAGTRQVVILVGGMLGFGWEWDKPLGRIAAEEDTQVQVFHWPMSSSLGAAARDFAARTNQLLGRLPPSVGRVLVFAHSAGGMITAFALDRLRVPAGVRLHVVNVGAPYAGMHTAFIESRDGIWAPLVIALGGTFTRYPRPAPRITVESWVTPWPGDPVMQPHYGHDPADPRVGPPGPRRQLPPGTDHNHTLEYVVRAVLDRESPSEARP